MNANEYQQRCLRTEVTPDFVNDLEGKPSRMLSRLLHGAMGMETEVGELIDMLKKHYIYGKAFDRTNVLEEVADVMWYCALALDACGFTMEQALQANIDKLLKRYPQKFSTEQALNRDLDAERAVLENA